MYNRNLLFNFEATEIQSLLKDAIAYVDKKADLKSAELRGALSSRLKFRKAFLTAVESSSGRDHTDFWDQCLNSLPAVAKTKHLGTAVSDSFSSKIQRRLASSIPPRPIVEISFDDSFLYLNQICHNGKEVYRMLKHPNGSNLIVR